ncbi:GL20080 [Drosophila persimilis]|uniref:GL20080 n=1 Tax=Drosophila persimilis TaxID=7234 RepID=B4H8F5_DROPE|nr:GL20080 [Drosophila persimilis]
MSFVEYYYFISFLLIFLILLRECYLFVKLKVEEWNIQVYERILREEMMLRLSIEDRQGGSLNTSEDRPHNRYGDIFFIEPSSEESARIRSQLEKDDKELPSYDEVMRMCNLTTPTAAAAAPHSPLAVPSPIGIAALPAPPYSESDPYAGAAEAGAGSAISPTVITMEPEPSTSRAAQIPTTTNVGRGAPLTLPNTASNTEV